MRTIREEPFEGFTLRLVEKDKRYIGVVIGDGIEAQVEGAHEDDVWRRLIDEATKLNPKYVGFGGARNRFLHWFKGGFQSPNYLAGERDYKVDAKTKLESSVPLDDAATGSGYGEAVLSVFRATNLLSPFEKVRLQDVLRGPNADSFIRAAAQFTLTPSKSALLEMEHALKPHESAKWTVATYLPFLWRPAEHMFLKPEATKDFAARVGHRFASDYEARLDIGIYDNLLDLAARTAEELSDLKPRDRIDVQSLIWVVGDYKEGREEPLP